MYVRNAPKEVSGKSQLRKQVGEGNIKLGIPVVGGEILITVKK